MRRKRRTEKNVQSSSSFRHSEEDNMSYYRRFSLKHNVERAKQAEIEQRQAAKLEKQRRFHQRVDNFLAYRNLHELTYIEQAIRLQKEKIRQRQLAEEQVHTRLQSYHRKDESKQNSGSLRNKRFDSFGEPILQFRKSSVLEKEISEQMDRNVEAIKSMTKTASVHLSTSPSGEESQAHTILNTTLRSMKGDDEYEHTNSLLLSPDPPISSSNASSSKTSLKRKSSPKLSATSRNEEEEEEEDGSKVNQLDGKEVKSTSENKSKHKSTTNKAKVNPKNIFRLTLVRFNGKPHSKPSGKPYKFGVTKKTSLATLRKHFAKVLETPINDIRNFVTIPNSTDTKSSTPIRVSFHSVVGKVKLIDVNITSSYLIAINDE
eukprot:g1055.t1